MQHAVDFDSSMLALDLACTTEENYFFFVRQHYIRLSTERCSGANRK